MLRFLGFVFTFGLGVAGFITVDYFTAKRWSDQQDGEELTFNAYLGDLPARLASLSASSRSGLPTALEDMMPAAPEGWTVRPTLPEDMAVFLPESSTDAPLEARRYVQAVGTAPGSGVDSAVLTYERGERRVVLQAIRYPDDIFSEVASVAERIRLSKVEPAFRGRPSMTIRGLDITEDVLPNGIRARYFMGAVGGQIHIRAVTSNRVEEEDLAAILGTMHVQAMNASVVNRTAGLGDVPVVVVVSALDEATREVYDAERAERREAAAGKNEEVRLAAEAELQKSSDAGQEQAPESAVKVNRGACNERAGTKFCGVGN